MCGVDTHVALGADACAACTVIVFVPHAVELVELVDPVPASIYYPLVRAYFTSYTEWCLYSPTLLY